MRSMFIAALLMFSVASHAQVMKGVLHPPFHINPQMDAAGNFNPRGYEAKSGWIEYADVDTSRTWFGYTEQNGMTWVMVKTAVKTMSGGVAEIDFIAGATDCGKRSQGRYADYLINPAEHVYDAQGNLIQNSGTLQNTPIPAGSVMADAVKYACSRGAH